MALPPPLAAGECPGGDCWTSTKGGHGEGEQSGLSFKEGSVRLRQLSFVNGQPPATSKSILSAVWHAHYHLGPPRRMHSLSAKDHLTKSVENKTSLLLVTMLVAKEKGHQLVTCMCFSNVILLAHTLPQSDFQPPTASRHAKPKSGL